MAGRSAKGIAMRAGDDGGREQARQQVDTAKIALGERGPVWWTDGAPDVNRHMTMQIRSNPFVCATMGPLAKQCSAGHLA